ncbi:MAG TPA: polysaccharide deacetylase family protein, partial [Chloroflexia bacterium]|nr:polysaccharide deacetylase family protein [Chloroflexia bacterium]
MKRAIVILLLLLSLTITAWGCDLGGIPTVTPIEPSPTPSATSMSTNTATATATTTSTATATNTSTPRLTSTATFVPTATRTNSPEPTVPMPTIVEQPTEDVEATEAVEPESTATQEETGETTQATPTTEQPKRPTPTAESAPAGGWSEVVRGYPGKKRVALTFDAGATGETMPAVLNVLRQRHIHITMFFTGKFVEEYPDSVKQAVLDGHEIANHTYSHTDSLLLTDQQLEDELA